MESCLDDNRRSSEIGDTFPGDRERLFLNKPFTSITTTTTAKNCSASTTIAYRKVDLQTSDCGTNIDDGNDQQRRPHKPNGDSGSAAKVFQLICHDNAAQSKDGRLPCVKLTEQSLSNRLANFRKPKKRATLHNDHNYSCKLLEIYYKKAKPSQRSKKPTPKKKPQETREEETNLERMVLSKTNSIATSMPMHSIAASSKDSIPETSNIPEESGSQFTISNLPVFAASFVESNPPQSKIVKSFTEAFSKDNSAETESKPVISDDIPVDPDRWKNLKTYVRTKPPLIPADFVVCKLEPEE